jgi:muconolactone delta-isomerase
VNSVDNGSFIFLLLYMDDMLTATNMKDLSTANKIIGMDIRRDGDVRRLWLSQADYVKKVLERFGMKNAKPMSTTLANHFHLSTS